MFVLYVNFLFLFFNITATLHYFYFCYLIIVHSVGNLYNQQFF